MKKSAFIIFLFFSSSSMAEDGSSEVSVGGRAFGGLMSWSTLHDRRTIEDIRSPFVEVKVRYSCRARKSEFLSWPYTECDSNPMASVRSSSFESLKIDNEELPTRYLGENTSSNLLYEKLAGHGEPLVKIHFDGTDRRAYRSPPQTINFRLSNFDRFVKETMELQVSIAENEVRDIRVRYIFVLFIIVFSSLFALWVSYKSAKFLYKEYNKLILIKYGNNCRVVENPRGRGFSSKNGFHQNHSGLDEEIEVLKDQAIKSLRDGDISSAKKIISTMEKHLK